MSKGFNRILCCVLALFLLCGSAGVRSLAEGDVALQPFTAHNAAASYCIETEQFLYENKSSEIYAPGVLTKLMALMVAYDLTEATARPLSTEVTVKGEWVSGTYVAGDRSTPYLGLVDGDKCTLEYLFACSLVANANDACSALVHYCAEELMVGTTADFLERMNQKAEELGLTNTQFADTIGYGGMGRTTARDAVKLAAAFYRYNDLVKLSDCYSYGSIRNKNYLKCDYLLKGYLLEGAVGLIAGHATNEGNYTVVTYYEKEGIAYAFVVMGGSRERQETDGTRWFESGNAYEDMLGMVPYVLEAYSFVTLCTEQEFLAELRMGGGAEDDVLKLVARESIELMIANPDGKGIETQIAFDPEKVYDGESGGSAVKMADAPVKQGDVLGTVTFVLDGTVLAQTELVAAKTVEVNILLSVAEAARIFLFEGSMGTIIKVIVIIIAVWLAIALIVLIVRLVLWILKKKEQRDAAKGQGVNKL